MSQSQPPSAPSGPNQSLLELIYAVRGLAQSVEYMHSDLRRLIEDDVNDRTSELRQFKDAFSKNSQALAVLPIQLSDRVENLLRRYEKSADGKVDDLMQEVEATLKELRDKLTQYVNIHEKKALVEDAVREVTGNHKIVKEEDITGRIELTKKGEIMLHGKFDWKKLAKAIAIAKWIMVTLAAGGGVAWLVHFIRELVG